jgi:hypothetical protein
MTGNITPKSYDPIVQHLEDAAGGAHTYGAALKLTHNDKPAILADLYALIGTPAGPGGVPPAKPGLKTSKCDTQPNKTCRTLGA